MFIIDVIVENIISSAVNILLDSNGTEIDPAKPAKKINANPFHVDLTVNIVNV